MSLHSLGERLPSAEMTSRPTQHRLLQRIDVSTVLLGYVVLLIALPSRLVVGPLGAAGTPANLLGVLLLVWWVLARAVPTPHVGPWCWPLRGAVLVVAVAALAAYGYGMARGYAPSLFAQERTNVVSAIAPSYSQTLDTIVRGADRGLIAMCAWLGVVLAASDGVRDGRWLKRLVTALVVAGAGMALLGIMQFFTGVDLAASIRLPGLRTNADFGILNQRSIFNRVTATAIHPIEFAVVLAAILPLAVHVALHARREHRKLAWAGVGLVGLAVPMAISRSGIVVIAVSFTTLFLGWGWRRRRRFLVILPFAVVATRLAVPGLVGTIRSLFTHLASDPSTAGRTGDYPVAGAFFEQSPVLGRGLFTFLPQVYRIFDNQWLLFAVELGAVGFAAFLLLFLTAVVVARSPRKAARESEEGHLGLALSASLLGLMVSYATFDALSFPMAAGLTFLLIGLSGASWRTRRAANESISGRPVDSDVAALPAG